MKVLFTSPILEYPAAGGPQLRVETSIKALARVSDLDVISGTAVDPATRAFYEGLCRNFEILPGSDAPAPRGRIARRIRDLWKRFHDPATDRAARFLLDYVDRRGVDVLWFGFGNISYPLIRRVKRLRPGLKVVCDTDSVWSRYVLRELPFTRGRRKLQVYLAGRRKIAEERAWVRDCEITTAVSEIDAEYYRSIAPDPGRVRIFSNVIDVDSYPASAPLPEGYRRPSIYLAGSFGGAHSPMNQAARWVLQEILPRVRAKRPDVHLYIVGRFSEKEFRSGEGVTVTGRLDSVLPYLLNTQVSLVPLKYESGTRFKILEAGACRIPLVSTTLGAEGLPVEHERHLLMADDSEAFADGILRILDDPALGARLAEECHGLVAKRYSVDALSEEARKILETLK